MSGFIGSWRPTMTAALIWLVGALPAPADETRLRVNIFAGPQNIGLFLRVDDEKIAAHGRSQQS